VIGQGQQAGLRLTDGQMITPTDLSDRVASLEVATSAPITVIVEGSHSGRFLQGLSLVGRTLVSSTGMGLSHYEGGGCLSFSQLFWTDIRQGRSVQEAFVHTTNILRHLPGSLGAQDPGLEAEGNRIPNQVGDYQLTSGQYIGAAFELTDLPPQIKATSLAGLVGGTGKRVVTQTSPVSAGGKAPQLVLAKEMLRLPTKFALRAPYPNPFNSEVVMRYTLPEESEVELLVYNAVGQEVRRLVETHQSMGHHRVVWNGRDERGERVATGLYIVRIQAGDFSQVRKMALVK